MNEHNPQTELDALHAGIEKLRAEMAALAAANPMADRPAFGIASKPQALEASGSFTALQMKSSGIRCWEAWLRSASDSLSPSCSSEEPRKTMEPAVR